MNWEDMLERLRLKVRTQQFRTWFSRLELKSADDGRVVVEAPNDFSRDWIERNHKDVLRSAICEACDNDDIELRIIAKTPTPTCTTESGDASEQTSSEQFIGQLNPNYTFDNFVVGPCNRLAHAAALAVADRPGEAYNPLFIHGGVGLGKTHLIQAVCHALLSSSKGLKILYASCEAFVNDYIRTIKDGSWEALRYKYRSVDVLLVDDIHFLSSSEHTQEEFFHTFNALYNGQKQILVTSDVGPRNLARIEERLVSRFKWGLVARMEPPAYETRVAIVGQKARMQGIDLPDDVAQTLAASVTSNIRELQGAVTRVLAQCRLTDSTPTVDLARTALKDSIADRKPVSIDDIIQLVCERMNVKVSDLQSRRKSKSIVFPRQLCMHLARKLTKHSLEEIGGYFGGRDHTTVLHADDKIKHQQIEDRSVKLLVERLSAELELTV